MNRCPKAPFATRLVAVLVALLATAPAPVLAGTTNLDSLELDSNLTVNGTTTMVGATTQTGNITSAGTVQGADVAATDDLTVGDDAAVTGDLAVTAAATFGSTVAITGALSLTVPLTAANANNSLKQHEMVVPVTNTTIADGSTLTVTVPVGKAMTVNGIEASIGTAISGGTSTLAITKNGATTLLDAANIDPTTIAANATTALTLTGTGASLVFVAGDCIKIVHTAGTQTTDGVGESIKIRYVLTDY